MRKKIIAVILAVISVFSMTLLGACGGGKHSGSSGEQPSNDDCVFETTELTLEAGQEGYIYYTGSASRYTAGNNFIELQDEGKQSDGKSRIKVVAKEKTATNVYGWTKDGKRIAEAKCRVTVTQRLTISMPEKVETATDNPIIVSYTSLGGDAATKMEYKLEDTKGIATLEYVKEEGQTSGDLILTANKEGQVKVSVTLSQKSADFGDEKVTASTEFNFINFFQDKYYEDKYFSFTKSTESEYEQFKQDEGGYNVPQNIKDLINGVRNPEPENPDPTEPSEPTEPENSGEAAATLKAMARVQAEMSEGYTVSLSEAVLNGELQLPQNLVIPAYHQETGDSEPLPVNKISPWLLRAFAEFMGQDKSLEGQDKKFEAPYAGYKGLQVKTVYIPNTVEEIGEGAFCETPITSVLFQTGSKLKVIGKNAFYRAHELLGCNFKALTELQIIGSGAFTESRMTEVFIPKSVTVVGSQAFAQIANDGGYNHHRTLKTVIFEEDLGEGHEDRAVTIYGGDLQNGHLGAFAYNLGLKTLRLCNIKRTQPMVFFQCWGLEDVYVDASTNEWAFSSYKYWDEEWEWQEGDGPAAHAADHLQDFGSTFIFAYGKGYATTLTVDNQMIEKLHYMPYAAFDTDCRGLLGFFGETAKGAECYVPGNVYVKDTLNPSDWFKTRYDEATSDKEGYTLWVLKNSVKD